VGGHHRRVASRARRAPADVSIPPRTVRPPAGRAAIWGVRIALPVLRRARRGRQARWGAIDGDALTISEIFSTALADRSGASLDRPRRPPRRGRSAPRGPPGWG